MSFSSASSTASSATTRAAYEHLNQGDHEDLHNDPLALNHLSHLRDFKLVAEAEEREAREFSCEEDGCWIYVNEACVCFQHDPDPEKQRVVQEALQHAITTDGPNELDGNIYRYMAFAQFGAIGRADDLPTLFRPPHDWCQCCMMYAGITMVFLLQVLAPLGILATSFDSLRRQFDWHAWEYYDWQQWMVVILAWGFLFLFIMSSYFKITQDARSGRKISRLARGLRYLEQPVCNSFLIIDALVNAWVGVIVSIVMFVVLYQEESAIEVLLDALGLAFLQNMDDIASDFGFLGGVWDSSRVGIFYATLAEEGVFISCGDPDNDDQFLNEYRQASWYTGNITKSRHSKEDNKDELRNTRAAELTSELSSAVEVAEKLGEDIFTGIPQCIRHMARGVLLILLLLAIPSPFLISSSAVGYMSTHPDSELAEVIRD